MDYLGLLNYSYELERECDQCLKSELDFLAEYIFKFTTYESEMSELFARKALDVCNAISKQKTFEFIKDDENRKWYMIMVNMPFFADKLDWGTSIRGAWWSAYKTETLKLESCGLWQDGEQSLELMFNGDSWNKFVEAMNIFVSD